MKRFARLVTLILFGCFVPFYSFAQQPTAVSFSSTDGVPLSGNVFGTGKTGVILSHMYPTDQKSWFGFAKLLAGEGFVAMTFDFRGYGESGGSKDISKLDRDVEGAYLYLKPKADRIFLVGASMGGPASIIVATRQPTAGVVSLGAPMSFKGLDAEKAIARLKSPGLFISSEEDGKGRFAAAARSFYQQAQGKKELIIFPGGAHGTRLFDSPHKEQVEKEILEFLRSS